MATSAATSGSVLHLIGVVSSSDVRVMAPGLATAILISETFAGGSVSSLATISDHNLWLALTTGVPVRMTLGGQSRRAGWLGALVWCCCSALTPLQTAASFYVGNEDEPIRKLQCSLCADTALATTGRRGSRLSPAAFLSPPHQRGCR